MISLEDKVRGMFLGIMVGDVLGLPVESWPAEKIKEKHGRITDILPILDHKYIKKHQQGCWSDDCQLSIAVAEGLIEAGLDMDAQAKWHVAAFKESTAGWGRSTRHAVRRLSNGGHWSNSGTDGGTGNGVAMKIAPVGAWFAIDGFEDVYPFVSAIAMMTHKTSMAVSSGLAHAFGIHYCFNWPKLTNTFDEAVFRKIVEGASKYGEKILPETLGEDRLTDRLHTIDQPLTSDQIALNYGGGSCYVYNSLPFSYAFFLRNPNSIETLYDVVSAGGDTDSNGSIVGSLLGALHGTSIFPKYLTDALDPTQKALLEDVTNRFIEKFCK